jgi:prepilin-type N-terminal cleavage/methylation domain-containing protein
MIHPVYKRGMTLVEIVIAVSIIGLLASFIIPAVNLAVRSRQNTECARKLRQAVAAFEMYRSETGIWPADKTPAVIPPEMTDYFAEMNIDEWWTDSTELGGRWDWDNGYNFKYSVSISNPSKTGQMTEFDKLIDDGNLNSGNFRKVNTQYHYIIEK